MPPAWPPHAPGLVLAGALVEARSEAELETVFAIDAQGTLVPPPPAGAPGWAGWPLWRWIRSNTYDYYRQHLPALQHWLSQLQSRACN